MNAWATAILWGMLQVTLLSTFGLMLYLAARRRGPAAGSLVSAGTLIAVLTVTALAVAPLPTTWDTEFVWNAITTWRTAAPAEATAENSLAAEANNAAAPVRPATGRTLPVAEFWTAFVDEMRRAPVEQSGATRRWPMVVLGVFGVGAAFGLFRLLAGATAVRSYRRHSRPIADAALYRLVQSLRQDAGCSDEIEVRETTRLSTPATVGCFAPLVLLPDGWRDWSRDELRAVLAHEIAHVARRDFLAGLLAQVTLAVHFYHPLVHWLVGRMRLEQELAADAQGMRASGGREVYLVTLAGMALRQDDLALSWAARPFLPTRGTFMRRIEMLRDSRRQASATLPRGGRAMLIGALAVAGLVVAGLRPGEPRLMAQAPATEAKFNFVPLPETLSLDHLPADVKVVAAASPVKLFGRPEMAPLAKTVNELFGQQLGVPVEQLELVRFAAVVMPGDQGPTEHIMLRTSAPHDWKPFLTSLDGTGKLDEQTLGAHKYYGAGDQAPGLCGFLPDDRTLILQPQKLMKPYLASFGRPRITQPRWLPLWDKVSKSSAAAAVDVSFVRLELDRLPQQGPAQPFAPLWKETDAAAIGLLGNEKLAIEGFALAFDADSTTRISRTLEAARTLFLNMEPGLRDQIALEPADISSLSLQALDAGVSVIDSAKLTTDANIVHLSAEGPGDIAATMAIIMPAVAKAREAARRAQSMNNLKQLALAMHNYADTYGNFPPAALIGPDGKTPHSWRVALLPYLGQDALYRQYKLDEPWDSENNKKVLAQIPMFYRNSNDDRPGQNSSYFAVTGEQTIFSGNQGSRFSDITDGTSNTIMLVEAKRDIPWTKPEDVPFDQATPAQLGGFAENGFNAAFADGSVRFLQSSVDAGLLKYLITRAGGELVDSAAAQTPPPAVIAPPPATPRVK
jgi:prepilin-type processing-associated H-X9-DG protein